LTQAQVQALQLELEAANAAAASATAAAAAAAAAAAPAGNEAGPSNWHQVRRRTVCIACYYDTAPATYNSLAATQRAIVVEPAEPSLKTQQQIEYVRCLAAS
jgi:hypothetical protein